MRQQKMIPASPREFGGVLLKTRKGRSTPRPLAVRQSMHLVLRSTRAKGEWSMRRGRNPKIIQNLISRFSKRYLVQVLSSANVGNHLHLHIQLTLRQNYYPWIRALTATIAMAVTGASRWRPLKGKFWDNRPYSKVVSHFKQRLRLQDYVATNQLEGLGHSRAIARLMVLHEQIDRRDGVSAGQI
jgi:REP element-mobilizing transposase RayT